MAWSRLLVMELSPRRRRCSAEEPQLRPVVNCSSRVHLVHLRDGIFGSRETPLRGGVQLRDRD